MQIKTNTLGIFYNKTGEDCGSWINLNLFLTAFSVQLKKKRKIIDEIIMKCQVTGEWTVLINYG